MPRGIYALEDEEAPWLRDRLTFESIERCEDWMREHVDDKDHPSNPRNPHLEHIFTFATTWQEVDEYILRKMDEYDRRYPPRPCEPISQTNIYHFPDSTAGLKKLVKKRTRLIPNLSLPPA